MFNYSMTEILGRHSKLALVLLLAGSVPCYISWQRLSSDEWTLDIRALFWSLHMQNGSGKTGKWTLCIPLISRLRDAIWMGILRLGGQPPQS